MNLLPAELRTPPLPVVAFINCAELHKDIGTYFNATLRPPLFFVSLPEANEAVLVRLFGTPRQHKAFSTPDGILKADWVSKQRTRRASVAVTFVNRSDVEGDPNAWMRMTRGLQAVKSASTHKGVWLVLVVVQDGPVTELPQDRIAGLWNSFEPKQLAVVSRQLCDPSLPPEQQRKQQEEQLRPLQQLVTEAAAAYYTAAGARLRQKQVDLSTSLGSCPPEIAAAIAFKLAVLAEFRQDWPGAVTSYQAAAAALQAVPLGRPTVSCQRHAEVAAVAEVVHFKAMMLLLHQQRYTEALQQLATHLAVFGRIPDGLPLAASATHYGWLSCQYQTAAEMVSGSRIDAAVLAAHPEATPCHLLMSAAQLALTRKTLSEQLVALRGGPLAFDANSVKKGRYLGQYERKQPEGPTQSSDLTDAEFCQYLEAEERRINHCQVVLDLLLQAQAAHLQQQQQQQGAAGAGAAGRPSSKGAADRVSARLAYLIAEQQMETHNLTAARKLLLQVVYTYRRDGWDALLLHSLLLLRDVCQRLKLHKESLLHSLEVASLADSLSGDAAAPADAGAAAGLLDREQAQGLAAAALLGLLAGPQDNKTNLKKPALQQQQQQPQADTQQTDGQQQQQQQQQQRQVGEEGHVQGVVQRQGSVSSGSGSPRSSSSGSWEYVVQQLDLAAALQALPPGQGEAGGAAGNVVNVLLQHKQQDFGWWRLVSVSGGFVSHSPDPSTLCLCVALRNNLPVPLPLEGASLTLSDTQGHWQQPLLIGPGPSSSSSSSSSSSGAHVAGVSGSSLTVSGTHADASTVAAGLSQLQLDRTNPAHPANPTPAGQGSSWPLQVPPGAWQQLHAVFEPRCIGTVACEALELRLSAGASVVFKVPSFAPGRPALGSAAVGPEGPFSLQQQVKLGSWAAKVQHVGPLPKLQLLKPELLLVGECIPLDITINVAAAQPGATLDLSIRAASPPSLPPPPAAGAAPPPPALTLLAALPDGKLHECSLEAQTLPVPKLAAGSAWTQRLWVRSRTAGGFRLQAVLSCPALVTQHAELLFKQPFEHRVRLSAEAGVHTLVGPSPAFAALNGGAAYGDGAGAAWTAAAAAAGSTGPQGQQATNDGPGGSSGSTSAVPLVVGQSLFVQVLVATSHGADLLLLGAELELEQGSQLQLLNSLSQQLAGTPLAASPGSVHCLLLQLVPTAKTAEPTPMGRLKLSWRRRTPAQPSGGSSGSSGGSSASAAAAAVAAVAAMQAAPAPSEDVEAMLELPAVVVQESLLSVKAHGPQHVTAGTSFPFTLQVHNLTSQPQEVSVSVQEAHGFVFAGSKQQVVAVVPRTIHTLMWTLVAQASGQLQLPAVRVSCGKLNCSTLTQGGSINVMPY